MGNGIAARALFRCNVGLIMTDYAAVIDDLKSRGLFHQCTDEQALREHLRIPRVVYNGFDPTADSLTIGNLVAIMILRVFSRYGHQPVVLVGGATGRIGDPSGKDAERQLLSEERIQANIAGQRPIFARVLGSDVPIVDNDSWFRPMSAYTFLRDVGKHFSVNQMLTRDSVRHRLEREGQGLSYTEFSYMLLQAYDFWHLYRERGVTVQTAGSDQWGNIVSGVDLIRRLDAAGAESRAFGLTAPLLTRSDGGKFGKTEAGAIWLTHHRPSGVPGTSPYAYYQFWLNVADADVRRYLLVFTDMEPSAVEVLMAEHEVTPHLRAAQRALARGATVILHGEAAMKQAESAAHALFSGAVAELELPVLEEAFSSAPASTHKLERLTAQGVLVAELLAETSLVRSKSEARQQLQSGAISLNGQKLGSPEARLRREDLLHGSIALLRRGKKAWHLTRWE